MNDRVRDHLASTRKLTEEALSAEGVQAVALCHQAKQELARAENLLVRSVTERACGQLRRHETAHWTGLEPS